MCAIINSSIRQGVVPSQWKTARITPLPKSFPPRTVENDIRPIAITNTIAKIAESFISYFFNSHFDTHLDKNQFGCTSGRSTTLALIKIMHDIFSASDKTGNFSRILFIDFKKAFDLIDHNILFQKFQKYNVPDHITAWSLDFLTNRSIFTKLGNIHSESQVINAGTPQGTISGPNDYKLLINDLNLSSPYIKYVDDTTAYSNSNKPDDPAIQQTANEQTEWADVNDVVINEDKCYEMVVYFGSKYNVNEDVPRIVINGRTIERVTCFKLLGVYISSDLSWETHVNYIVSKASKRIYCIRKLVSSGVDISDIVTIYCTVIRSVLEYACPVWHPGLTQKQSQDIERIQKRCLSLIYPKIPYEEALDISGLEELKKRRDDITCSTFRQIAWPNHFLHSIIPKKESSHTSHLRNFYPYQIPLCKPMRYGRDFIPFCIKRRF